METILLWGLIAGAVAASVWVEFRNDASRKRALHWSEQTELHRLARCVGVRRER